jgi:hypothetical protein
MAQGWKSDWEKLFAKCAADEDYCQRLESALRNNDDALVGSLLDNIGVGGEGANQRSARLNVLKEFRAPMTQVTSTFGGGGFGDFVAP